MQEAALQMPEHTKIAVVPQGLCVSYCKRRLVSGEATVWKVKIESVIRVCQSKRRALRLRILCGAYTKGPLSPIALAIIIKDVDQISSHKSLLNTLGKLYL